MRKNIDSLQNQFNYSTRANISLKLDYDLLQEKLDKTMKTANNQVQDRNEMIDKLNNRVEVLQNFYEESSETIEA